MHTTGLLSIPLISMALISLHCKNRTAHLPGDNGEGSYYIKQAAVPSQGETSHFSGLSTYNININGWELAWTKGPTAMAFNSTGIYIGSRVGDVYFIPWGGGGNPNVNAMQRLIHQRYGTVRGMAADNNFVYAAVKEYANPLDTDNNTPARIAKIPVNNPGSAQLFDTRFFCCDGTNQHQLNGLQLYNGKLYGAIGVYGDGDRNGLNGQTGAAGGWPGELIEIDPNSGQVLNTVAVGLRNPYRFTIVPSGAGAGFWVTDNNNNANAAPPPGQPIFRPAEKVYHIPFSHIGGSPFDAGHPYCVPGADYNSIF